jgi:hypothetical protein
MPVNKLLKPISNLQSLDDFINYVGYEIAHMVKFFSCVALESKAGTESIFFMPSAGDGPDALIRTAVALTVATRAHRAFVAYQTDLSGVMGGRYGPLGTHQAVFFGSNSERSHPFVFCKLDADTPEWKITEIARMNDPDKYKSIILSDLHQDIASGSKDKDYVFRARASLERWRDDVEWDWERYDRTQ